MHTPIKRALLSAFDKTGLVELAKQLIEHKVEIISSGGTYKTLTTAGLTVTEVSQVTQFPEMMSGRVKTLHPNIHAGILARRGTDENTLAKYAINPIDLVVVNLYPFAEVTTNPNCDLATAIENIDVGGPTLIRAAAKNHRHVTVLTHPSDYITFIENYTQHNGANSHEFRQAMAVKAFEYTALYDSLIHQYLHQNFTKKNKGAETQEQPEETRLYTETFLPPLQKKQALRYGENPHQQAVLFAESGIIQQTQTPSITHSAQLQGKSLSYNNLVDADAALECVKYFNEPACAIIKHANPCGAALADSIEQAYEKAYQADPTSAFGGIIAFNRTLDQNLADRILSQQFVEVLIAPDYTQTALGILKAKSNLRVLKTGPWSTSDTYQQVQTEWVCKKITAGLLVQTKDYCDPNPSNWQTITKRSPTQQELIDLQFAWQIVRIVKSNAIVFAKNGATIGIGAGQMSRVFSTDIAAQKTQQAGLSLNNSVLASDAFFPFNDGVKKAAEHGVSAIIQPGGSKRDQEVIDCANKANIAMIFTGKRHFNH